MHLVRLYSSGILFYVSSTDRGVETVLNLLYAFFWVIQCYIPTFRNTLSVPSSEAGRYEESLQHSEHGESLKSRMFLNLYELLNIYGAFCISSIQNYILESNTSLKRYRNRVGSRFATVDFTTIHFYNPCPVGTEHSRLVCITVATQASFLYLVHFYFFSGVRVFLLFFFYISAVILSRFLFFHP